MRNSKILVATLLYILCLSPSYAADKTVIVSSCPFTTPSDLGTTYTIHTVGAGSGGSGANNTTAPGSAGAGGGYSSGTQADIVLAASTAYGCAIGTGGAGGTGQVGGQVGSVGGDSWFCNSTSNCASIGGTAVKIGAKGGAAPVTVLLGGVGGAAASGVGSTTKSGGNGGASSGLGYGGAGGGGASGPAGDGAVGGATGTSSFPSGGSGGGGSAGGTAGNAAASGSSTGGNGGDASNSSGHGAGGTAGNAGAAGTSTSGFGAGGGGGGGGGTNNAAGGAGGAGKEWTQTSDSTQVGSGGGGGGGGGASGTIAGANGAAGGGYGGGGGGGASPGVGTGGNGGNGANGGIVIIYTPAAAGSGSSRLSMMGIGGGGGGAGGAAPVVSTNAITASSPTVTNQTVGTASASNSPTSWSVTSCAGCTGYFTIDNSGVLTCTATCSAAVTGAVGNTAQTLTPVLQATNGSGSGSGSVPINFLADGKPGAPACTIQYPTMLSGYVAIPPQIGIPGVTYCVGPSTAKQGTFKNPDTLTTGGCLTIATLLTGKYIQMDGDNCTVDNYDFSLGAHSCNWSIFIESGDNWIISNNNFCEAAPGQVSPVIVEGTAKGGTITNNIIDCNGPAGGTTLEAGCLNLNQTTASGKTVTITYNWFKTDPTQIILVCGGGSGNCGSQTWRWNLFYNSAGTSDQGHADLPTIPGQNSHIGTWYSGFNTFYQDNMYLNTASQGFATDQIPQYTLIDSFEADHDTWVLKSGAAIIQLYKYALGNIVGNFNLHHAYFDPTGLRLDTSSSPATGHLWCADTGTGGQSGTFTNPTNNVDMRTGTSYAIFNAC